MVKMQAAVVEEDASISRTYRDLLFLHEGMIVFRLEDIQAPADLERLTRATNHPLNEKRRRRRDFEWTYWDRKAVHITL
jgi:hypothetical protein